MFDIYGKYTGAVIYSDICESEALSQLYDLCNHPIFEGARIRIMPDVHAGAGCTVGTTICMERKAVIPSIVGADIGCGVYTVIFESGEIDYKALDDFIISNIPCGMAIRNSVHPRMSNELKREIRNLCEALKMYRSEQSFIRSCGSLGGGNHYIEVGLNEDGRYSLSIHTGSRGLGKCVAEYFSDKAKAYIDERGITGINRNMPYLEDEGYFEYVRWMQVCQSMAAASRRLIAGDILAHLGARPIESFDTVHNYIEMHREGGITIRKGSVSAKSGEKLAIPLNMRDGVLIARGRGNEEWNFSAPHGAGRLMSRAEAKATISLDKYREVMAGIESWSVVKETVDESPMAYKPASLIMEQVRDTVDILSLVRPRYNFKARSILGK
ncbi:MAG: RtcB family protein [Clostridia bacterium]|nr:RtcB family protein [Clostridia bacterium]